MVQYYFYFEIHMGGCHNLFSGCGLEQSNPKLPSRHRHNGSQMIAPLHPMGAGQLLDAPWEKGTFVRFPGKECRPANGPS